jgi:hypothetical protein
MRATLVALLLAVSTAAATLPAAAQMEPVRPRERRPGSALVAAASNVVYFPVRLGVTVLNAWFGGFVGFINLDDERGGRDTMRITDGPGFLQPKMVAGEQPVQFGHTQFRPNITGR